MNSPDYGPMIDPCPHCGQNGGQYFNAGYRVQCICQDPSTAQEPDQCAERLRGVELWNTRAAISAMGAGGKPLGAILNEIIRDDVHNDIFSEDITGAHVKELSDLILSALSPAPVGWQDIESAVMAERERCAEIAAKSVLRVSGTPYQLGGGPIAVAIRAAPTEKGE